MIGKYYRLSLADGDLGRDGKDESNSIENQRLLIGTYLESKEEFEGQASQEYIDDGYTGTNFERPGFERLMDDVRFGRIDTVIVKDMSRFGRDYIGVGDYLEQIFPVLGVRFIAVNNNYDSDKYKGTTMGLDMAIGNLVNSMYSRDISKKLKTSNYSRWKKGYRTCGTTPFGYMPNPEEKGRYAIDPEAAEIVRRVFDLALEGRKCSQIAYRLNEEGVQVPSEYYRQRQVKGKSNFHTVSAVVIWDGCKVRRILQNYEYTGALVLGKRQTVITGSKVSRAVPDEERIIHDGVNEAIVTREEFEQAQCVIRAQKKIEFYKENDYLLKGKIRCGTCGRAMNVELRSVDERVWCDYGREMKKHSGCSPQDYSMKKVEGVVRYSVYNYCRSLAELSGKMEEYTRLEAGRKAEREKSIGELNQQMGVLRKEKMRLYENYAGGNITLDAYKKKREVVDAEINALAAEQEKLKAVGEPEPFDSAACTFIKEAKGIAEEMEKSKEKELTRPMVEKMVEAVYIYGDNRMEVKFRFGDAVKAIMEQVGAE
ncbi:MAG: recombinase family protein [Lachnospiraceae bacterium]|nr:recombinase family protein [Lachnospiraceae bacterium]